MNPTKFQEMYGFDQEEFNRKKVVFMCKAGIRSYKALIIANQCGLSE